MPKKSDLANPLYFFLKAVYPMQQLSYDLDTNAQGVRYVRIPLNTTRESRCINHTKYQLQNHHISIYENYTDFSRNNDFHYTATLHAKKKPPYGVHVYFDKQDKIIGQAAPNEEDNNSLIDMGIKNSSAVMTRLRQAQQELITNLTNQFNAERCAVFSMPTGSIEEIDECLRLGNQVLERAYFLQNIGGSDQQIKLLQAFLEDIDWEKAYKLKAQNPQVPAFSSEQEMPILEESCSSSEKIKTQPKIVKNETNESAQVTALAELKSCLQKLQPFTNASHNPDILFPLAYHSAAIAALEALLICQDKKAKNLNPYFNDIDRQLIKSQNLCIDRLIHLLNTNSPEIHRYAKFLPYLPDCHITTAVENQWLEQLEFLLRNRPDIPINRMRKSEGNREKTLLELALEQSDLPCFELLLKHGASAMIEGRDGLPLAHTILQRQDQFSQALLKQCKDLPAQLAYTKRLAELLKVRVQQADLAKAVRSELESAIKRYEQAATLGMNLRQDLNNYADMLSSMGLENAPNFIDQQCFILNAFSESTRKNILEKHLAETTDKKLTTVDSAKKYCTESYDKELEEWTEKAKISERYAKLKEAMCDPFSGKSNRELQTEQHAIRTETQRIVDFDKKQAAIKKRWDKFLQTPYWKEHLASISKNGSLSITFELEEDDYKIEWGTRKSLYLSKQDLMILTGTSHNDSPADMIQMLFSFVAEERSVIVQDTSATTTTTTSTTRQVATAFTPVLTDVRNRNGLFPPVQNKPTDKVKQPGITEPRR